LANTFIATVEAIYFAGTTPVFVEVDPRTWNIDANRIEAKITEKTRALLPVHLYGQPADMPRIREIAKKHNLIVIGDAAQSIGSKIKVNGQGVSKLGSSRRYISRRGEDD
jgi:dTDP-4-amino-4,6-dideoxygalactose transaminase